MKKQWMMVEEAIDAMMIAYKESDTESIQQILDDYSDKLTETLPYGWDGRSRILFPSDLPENQVYRTPRIVLEVATQSKLEIASYIFNRFQDLLAVEIRMFIMDRMYTKAMARKKEEESDIFD